MKELKGSIHPDWDNYSESMKDVYLTADRHAQNIATKVIADINSLPLPPIKIYYRQQILESVINILTKKV